MKSDPEGFASAQKEYITRTHYEPVKEYANQIGLAVSDRGVQEALYSQAVQTSGAGNEQILDNLLEHNPNLASMTPSQQLEALYKERADYVTDIAQTNAKLQKSLPSLQARYIREEKQAQAISRYYQLYYK